MSEGKLSGRLAATEQLRGRLSATEQLGGRLSEIDKISGMLYIPRVIIHGGEGVPGDGNYANLYNKPAINWHTLRAGNNTLQEIGIEDQEEFTILEVIDAWNNN